MNDNKTHFGYQTVSEEEKTHKVSEVFSSVASRYDLMNDLMSMGIHRIWKKFTIHQAGVRKGQHVLDVAGGTADLSMKFLQQVGDSGSVTIADLNMEMIRHGRDKLLDEGKVKGIHYVQANAETLPFASNQFDLTTIAFGLRNVTDKQKALGSMYDSLKYGGRLMILEFSKMTVPALQKLYDEYSFRMIPWLGRQIADDEDSYRYLVESIRMHPDQDTLQDMMEQAGFERVSYHNLTGGIVALHTGYKI